MHLLPPPDYWCTSFFWSGPGTPHEIVFSAFSRGPLGRANTFSFLFLLLTPRIPLPSHSPYFLVLRPIPFCTSNILFLCCMYPLNFSMDKCLFQIPSYVYPSILPPLRNPIFFQLILLLRSPVQPYQLWLATPSLFLARVPDITISTVLRLCFKWAQSQLGC